MDRRRFLIYAGVSFTTGIAGCSEDSETQSRTESETETNSEYETDSNLESTEIEETEVPPPIETPENVPHYSVEDMEDVSYNNVVRFDANITAKGQLPNHSRDDVLKISREIILKIINEQEVNAISCTFWRENQTVGAEPAHAIAEWAPNGNWKDAGKVETGDYSKHEFHVFGTPYYQAIEIDSPDSVKLQEDFSIEAIIENKSVTSGSIEVVFRSGGINDETFGRNEINLNPHEQTDVESSEISIDSFTHDWEKLYILESSGGSTTIGNVHIEITPLEIGEYYTHPEDRWEIGLTDIRIDGGVVYAEFDRNIPDGTSAPKSTNFYLVTNEEEFQGLTASNGSPGEIEFSTEGDISTGEFIIKYEDIDITVIWDS